MEYIPNFRYDFESGPIDETQLHRPITTGNCRLLLQCYFYAVHGIYFSPEQLLNPYAFQEFGTTLVDYDSPSPILADIRGLPDGTVLYGEKLTDTYGNPADYTPAAFESDDDYIVRLHSAIYTSSASQLKPFLDPTISIDTMPDAPMILHATAISGRVCVWSLATFLQYYKPIRAKQFTNAPTWGRLVNTADSAAIQPQIL